MAFDVHLPKQIPLDSSNMLVLALQTEHSSQAQLSHLPANLREIAVGRLRARPLFLSAFSVWVWMG